MQLGLARRRRLLARVAFGGLGREHVDVGEDRFGEQVQRLGLEPGRAAERDEPAPRHSGAGPVGAEQRVEAPPGAHLAPPERAVDVRPLDRAAGLDLGEEVAQRLLHSRADPGAELAFERSRVRRDPAHRVDDLVGDVRERRPEDLDDPWRELVPRLIGQ